MKNRQDSITRAYQERARLVRERDAVAAPIIAALPKLCDQEEAAKRLCISRQAVARIEKDAIWKVVSRMRHAAAQFAAHAEHGAIYE